MGTNGVVLTIAGRAITAVLVISMVQEQPSLLPVRLAGVGLVLCRLGTPRGDHHPGPVAALVVRRTAYRSFPWVRDQANAIFGSAENLLLALLWGSMGIALLSRRHEVDEPVLKQPAGTG